MTSVAPPAGDLARTVASGSADLAKRVGGASADLARRIGPKRALIGLLVVGAVVGGTIALVRYLRSRDGADDVDETDEDDGPVKRPHKLSRAKRKHAHALSH